MAKDRVEVGRMAHGIAKRGRDAVRWNASDKKAPLKRENKNQPPVLSSKRQVSRFRVAPGLSASSATRTTRDPRFDQISTGYLDEHVWRQKYGFILDTQKAEIQEMKELLQASAASSKSKSNKSGGGEKKRRCSFLFAWIVLRSVIESNHLHLL